MQLDALTLAALAGELRALVLDARVEDVFAPAPDAIALQLYGGGRNRWLIASAHPQLARAHLVDRKPRKLVAEPPAFVMLLRKHIEGARLIEVRQPPAERVLELGFRPRTGASTAGGAEPIWLIAELMGRLSNIILCDAADTILGALHPVSARVNAYRALLPNAPYLPPPPQSRTLHGASVPRLDARDVTGAELSEAAEDLLVRSSERAAEAQPREQRRRQRGRRGQESTIRVLLASTVAGLGTDAAEEAAFRAMGTTEIALSPTLDWESLAAAVRELGSLAETNAWEPTLVYAPATPATPAESAPPIAFAVYRPERFAGAELRPAASVSAMLAAYYADAEWRAGVEGVRAPLAHTLRTQIERCRRKDAVLRQELAAFDDATRLRLEADTLLAFQAEAPAHATTWTVQNPFGAPGETLEIALDPRLSAVENANARYTRYHKLHRAAARIPPQIEANTAELARLEQFQTDLTLAETPAEVAQARAVIAEAGYLGRGAFAQVARSAKGGKGAKNAKNAKRSGKGTADTSRRRAQEPGGTPSALTASAGGLTILVGKNSRQNETVTFREARPNDTWLHARGVPGAHVIIRNGGRPVDEATLREAAALAAYFSQARTAGSVPVDHTEVRYVRHMKGGGPGMVVYERERTLHVAPRAPTAAP